MVGVGVGALAIVALAAVAAKARDRRTGDVTRPVIAVLPLPLRGSDSSSAWLIDGLPQMIDGKLASVPAIDVVSPAQVRAVVTRSGRKSGDPFPEVDARDLAQRVGASLVAHGSLARDGKNLVLDLSVHDVRGPLVRSFVLTDSDPLSLADQAAARILGAINISLGGPRLQDVETSSLEAYQHYIRSIENGRAGRITAAVRDLEASIALDSGFIPALRQRLGVAAGINDTVTVRKMRALIQRHSARASEFDRLEQELNDAYAAGEHERTDALARALVRRYPRDPRVYWAAVAMLSSHGAFEEAERVAIAGIRLDSLAMDAGSGPCSQCVGFHHIITLALQRWDFTAAANWARRWISEQPDAPSPWATLGLTYLYANKTDSALALQQRAITLSGNEMWALDAYTRMLLVTRRYAEAESVITRLAELHGDFARAEVADLRSLLAREHGRFREADRIILGLATGDPEQAWFVNLVHADNRKLLGDYAGASRAYERLVHGPSGDTQGVPHDAGAVRAYCWHHALAADALGPQADTAVLRGIADTLETGCKRSYYGRDWILYHHVRGLLAMRTGRYADADREFSQAIWARVEGWGRTAVELAKARMGLGRPQDAIAPLRQAYATRLDAMGRYVPISELDYWMSRAFAEAGQTDSARVYAGYVERAWRNADPEVRQRLPIPPGTVAR
jgi:tetratricopeptide (TPR) repeat protein